ncbi:MAG: FUN14 domain-containing protein [Candidatus Nitrosopolaris sp.]
MIYEQLFPLAGGGALGFAVGYALKKITKFVVIGLGLIALLLGYLEVHKWISVNWAIMENQTSAMMTHATHKAYIVTQHMGPIGLGAVGFMPGLAVGFAK